MLRKINREIEKKYGCRKGSLLEAVTVLRNKFRQTDKQILDISVECWNYCNHYNTDYTVTFNMYVSCLKSQSKTPVITE